jgi:hypothetical protein
LTELLCRNQQEDLSVRRNLDLDDVLFDQPAAQRELRNLREYVKLLEHKVITCGVAPRHPDATLTRKGAYANEWKSPQADDVRKLRDERDSLRAELDALRHNTRI